MIFPSSQARDAARDWDPTLEDFERFLRGGGSVSIWDWMLLPAEWQELLVEAADRIEHRRAALIGTASQGMDAAAAIASKVDGGAMALRVGLERAAQAHMDRRSG